jgi:hypothetical protein
MISEVCRLCYSLAQSMPHSTIADQCELAVSWCPFLLICELETVSAANPRSSQDFLGGLGILCSVLISCWCLQCPRVDIAKQGRLLSLLERALLCCLCQVLGPSAEAEAVLEAESEYLQPDVTLTTLHYHTSQQIARISRHTSHPVNEEHATANLMNSVSG